MRGPPTAKNQKTWEGTKVNWFMVLAKGKAHVEVMPQDWNLDGVGLAEFVARLKGILRRMLGLYARLPKTVFTDRGTGMYSPQGHIVRYYAEALDEAGFETFWGHDASQQAADMPDLLLHENAVGVFRNRMRKEKPVVVPWKETVEMWTERAAKVVQWMNDGDALDRLCRRFPERVQACSDAGGERLPR